MDHDSPLALVAVNDGPDDFEGFLLSQGLAANTIKNYLSRLRVAERVAAELGIRLESASAQELAAISFRTAPSNAVRGQLRAVLKHWYLWQGRLTAPIGAVRVPPAPRMVCKALDADEARRLVEVATGWWPEGTAVLFGMFLALRRTEIAIAEWDRFDDNLEWYRVFGKGDKTATLPVHPALKAELEDRRQPGGWVFPGRFGGPSNPATIWSWTKEVGAAADLDHVRTHVLRHTALTTALDNTENLRAVMEFARHSRPQTTAGYTRTTKHQLLRVVEALAYSARDDTEKGD